jgi:hypothetical protein
MKNIALVAIALAALCVIGAVVLVALNKAVPPELWAIAFAALTGGAGIAVPTVTTTTPAAVTPPTTTTTA